MPWGRYEVSIKPWLARYKSEFEQERTALRKSIGKFYGIRYNSKSRGILEHKRAYGKARVEIVLELNLKHFIRRITFECNNIIWAMIERDDGIIGIRALRLWANTSKVVWHDESAAGSKMIEVETVPRPESRGENEIVVAFSAWPCDRVILSGLVHENPESVENIILNTESFTVSRLTSDNESVRVPPARTDPRFNRDITTAFEGILMAQLRSNFRTGKKGHYHRE